MALDQPIHVQALTAAGTTQATATAITTPTPVFVLAAGDGTVGIKLPKAVKGKVVHLKNTGSGNLKVYPSSGDAINAIAADSPLTFATVASATLVAKDSTTWYSIPLLPS